MEWTDEAIVLGTRRHGEGNAILEVMTRAHGRHLGLVRGGAGSRLRPVLQPGNSLRTVWRARLDEHLGHFMVEGLTLRAGTLMTASHAVYALTHLASLVRLLAERDPHESVFDALESILDQLDAPALGGQAGGLFRIATVGGTWLRARPRFLRCERHDERSHLRLAQSRDARCRARQARRGATGFCGCRLSCDRRRLTPTAAELTDGFALTGFFLARHALEPRGQPFSDARAHFIAAIARSNLLSAAIAAISSTPRPIAAARSAHAHTAADWDNAWRPVINPGRGVHPVGMPAAVAVPPDRLKIADGLCGRAKPGICCRRGRSVR